MIAPTSYFSILIKVSLKMKALKNLHEDPFLSSLLRPSLLGLQTHTKDSTNWALGNSIIQGSLLCIIDSSSSYNIALASIDLNWSRFQEHDAIVFGFP